MARTVVNSKRSAKRGIALLTVLLLVMTLAVLVYGMQRDVMREIAISGNVRDDLRAAFLAQMGLVRAQVVLRLDESAEYDSLNEPWADRLTWEGETWGSEYGEGGASATPPDVVIIDEERRFNLLTLVRGDEEQRKAAAEILKRLIEICRRQDERLAGEMDGPVRIVRRAGDDGTSPDGLVRNLISYLEERMTDDSDQLEFSADPDAGPGDVRGMRKQSPFEMLTLGELKQVEGWTDQLLYGPVRRADQPLSSRAADEPEEYRSWHTLTDEERFEHMRQTVEAADERSRDPNPIGILQFLTLYTEGRININTAPREVLLALDADLTWDVVDQIMTARESRRQAVQEAEETGQIPITPPPGESEEEEEDQSSFRAADIASYAAFVQRVTGQGAQNGQGAAEIQDFNSEIFNRMRPWLSVRSAVYSVEVSAKVGKVSHGIKAIYRRSFPPAQQQQQQQPQQQQSSAFEETGMPAEPQARLTLLFRDVINR